METSAPQRRRAATLALTAALAATAIATAPAAQAQSSVTLYGRVAGGVDYMNHIDTGNGQTGSLLRYGSNQWGTSLWGLRAREDLGGGLSAVMNLESGFASGEGQGGGSTLFSRYAVVGLASATYGTLWLGRAMGLPDAEGWALDPMGMQAISIGTLQNGRSWGSRANTVTYTSPVWGGLSVRGQLGLNGTAGNFNAGRQLGASVSYENGPLVVKGIYEEIRDANGEFTNLYTASRLYEAGATYAAGNLKLYGGYSLTRSGGATVPDADNPLAANKQQLFWLGANYQLSPAITVIGGAYRAIRNQGAGNGTLLALGANYNFSKRTLVYATVGTVLNGANAAFSVEAGNNRPLAGASQQGFYTGVVHLF